MSNYSFEAVLEKPEGVGTWTYVTIPFSVAETFGRKGLVRVKGAINGVSFRSSAMPRGGGAHFLVVSKELRGQIGARHGDRVQVVIELDTEERHIEVPEDFSTALARKQTAQAAFDKLSYSHQKEYLVWIASTRREETRKRRIEVAVERLATGARLKTKRVKQEQGASKVNELTLGTNIVTQVGIVVKDIEAKAKAWSDILGLPMPNIIITDGYEKAQTEYKGQPSQAQAKLAFFNMGQVSVELIEPIGEPSTWKDHLDAHGDSLHHVAFVIKGMKDKTAYLDAQGVPLVQRGEYTGGRYAYLDGAEKLGAILELLEND